MIVMWTTFDDIMTSFCFLDSNPFLLLDISGLYTLHSGPGILRDACPFRATPRCSHQSSNRENSQFPNHPEQIQTAESSCISFLKAQGGAAGHMYVWRMMPQRRGYHKKRATHIQTKEKAGQQGNGKPMQMQSNTYFYYQINSLQQKAGASITKKTLIHRYTALQDLKINYIKSQV